MTTMFNPTDETPDGWRRTILGWIACKFGWHFGQIAIYNQLICARCKTRYKSDRTLCGLSGVAYVLPKRSILHLKDTCDLTYDLKDIKTIWELSHHFECYVCLDCCAGISDAQEMVEHQRRWHGWGTAWARFVES